MALWLCSLLFSLLLAGVPALAPTPDAADASLPLSRKLPGPLTSSTSSIHFPVHHHLTSSPPPATATVLQQDSARVSSLLSSLAGTGTSSTSTPLRSGLSLGIGNYVAVLLLGNPPTRHHLILDTGSSLTWVQCSPCNISCYPQDDPLFQSPSFSPLPCSSPMCRSLKEATLNPPGCSSARACTYQATYGDSSASLGHMGSDRLSLGPITLPNFVFGCGNRNIGLFGRTSGIVGLARSPLSLLTQLGSRYPNAFSYCLPTPAGEGYLSIGAYDASEYSFTPLLRDPLATTPLYFIRLVAIKVANRPIDVPAVTYGSMRTIIDSGTVITRLPPRVLDALTAAVTEKLRGHARAEAFSILETCWTGKSAGMGAALPEVALVFDGGAEVRLGRGNVMYDVGERNITCMAFARSRGVAIVGNKQQQTLKVVYDVGRSMLGFAQGGCT